MTPDAERVVDALADSAFDSDVRRCLERFFRWGAAPTVDAYCDLFAPGGTLLDADMAEPITGEAIRESITRVLTLLPDFRFTPVGVVTEGSHVFVHAANRATMLDRALAWDAVYALTLDGDRIGAGRRYYDQAALVLGNDTFGADQRALPPGTDAATAPAARLDLGTRAAAWNRHDIGALLGPLGTVRLHMSGVSGVLEPTAAVAGALARFAVRSEGLAMTPGAVATDERGTAIEWVGQVGVGAAARRFAMVEMLSPPVAGREWRLVFNTLGF